MTALRTFLILVVLTVTAFNHAFAQSTLLQAGATAPGRTLMYTNSYSSQPIVQDSGPAAGGGPGTGLSELGLTVRGTGTAPYANAGSGPLGTNFCDQDAPSTNPTGYHALCMSPNAQGGGLISYEALGNAPQLPLNIQVNGVNYPFPTPSGCSGCTSVASNAALKQLTAGAYPYVQRTGFTQAGDGGAGLYVWSGTACSLNNGAGDNGSQVAPASGTGCWVLAAQPLNDIRIWGATTSTDIGQYIQASYTANVGCIWIPPGIWPWSSAVSINQQVPCFRGAGWNEAVQASSLSTANMTGTWIHISNTNFTPVTITGVNGQGGVPGFSNMAFYEDQPTPGTGSYTPNSYPYIFSEVSSLGRVDYDNLYFYNDTHCISIFQAAREHITNIYGQPQGTCLKFDDQTDVSVLDNVEFWPFWNQNNSVIANQTANVDPILYLRSDSPSIQNIQLVFGYHSALAFAQSASGVTTGAQIGSVQGDAAKYGIWVEPSTTNVQLQIGSLRSAGEGFPTGTIAGSETYRDDGASTNTDIANVDCYYAGSSCIDIEGSGSVSIGNSTLWNFNNDNNSSTAYNAGTEGFIKTANQASIANPANSGTIIPPFSAGGVYALRGVRQYWTPTLAGTTTTGTVTYTSQLGTFWYDGSMLTLNFSINVSNFSGFVGSLAIRGLPVATSAPTGQNAFCQIGSTSGVVTSTNYQSLAGIAAGGGLSQILLIENGSGQPTVPAPISVFGSTFIIQGSCTIPAGQ